MSNLKKQASRAAALIVFSLSLGPVTAVPETGGASRQVAARLQAAFNSGEKEAFASLFVPELRDQEAEFRRDLKENLGLERASFFPPESLESGGDGSRIFLQAMFENEHSALIQTWDLLVRPEDGGLIGGKRIRNDLGLLYKVSIPTGRAEAVSWVEIRHQDISLNFSNALIFYDNIPGLETALLIMGQGLVSFSPSLPREKHQLELALKTRTFNRRVIYAFCRVSDSFFRENMRIAPAQGSGALVPSETAGARAASLFQKHYPRYFTVVNSLSRERLSFLPQGREAVFDFMTDEGEEFTYIYTPFAEEEVHFIEQDGQRLLCLYSPPDEEGRKKMFISFQEKFDVRHYDLEVSISPKTSQLSARARLSIRSRVDVLDNLKLRLNKDLEIVRVQDHRGRELFTTRDKFRDLVYIYLLEPVDREETFSLEVFYRGRLVPPEQSADVLAAGQVNETFILTPPKYESYLYSRSAGWYPEPTEEDYFTARQRIIVPPEYACVANGPLVERSTLSGPPSVVELDKAGHAVYVFETKRPVKYLSFIVGAYDEEARSPGPPPLSYLISSNVFSLKRMNSALLRDIVSFYERTFGPYPYEELTVVHRLWPVGGGHSPASFVVLNELPRSVDSRLPINASSPVDLSRWREYFIAHEIAHQWWGQGLTWRTYHDQWLSEGMAQFATALFLGERHGERALTGILEKFCQWTNQYSRWGQISLGSRLSYLNFDAYQAILYNKTTVVLNLLKEVVGSEAFFDGLRNFFRSHAYGAARTSDFRRVMEASAGRDLGPFFKGWFDTHLLPETRVKLSEEEGDGGRLLRVDVRQQAEMFVFPLWLEWQEGNRRVVHRLVVDRREASFSLPFAGRLKKVKVNPQRVVPGSFKVES